MGPPDFARFVMDLPGPGDILASKYQIESAIGTGGFAQVYRAVDTTVGRPVAIKVLRVDGEGDLTTLEGRFRREAKVLAALTDNHTLRLFDFGRADDMLYMVFELLPGEDLSDLLERRGTLTERETVHVMRQVLSSLREAHSAGLLHRDIKPKNLRVYEHNGDPLYVKVMDFGIARSFDDDTDVVTRIGHTVGTPRYMSPEQLVGLQLFPSSDLFSLALVALEMLTGDPRAPLDAAIGGRGLQIRGVSRGVTRLLERLLDGDVTRRPQTAEAVLVALDAAMAAPVPAPSPRVEPPPPAATAPMASRPAEPEEADGFEISPGLIAAIVVVGVGSGALLYWKLESKPEPEPEPRPVATRKLPAHVLATAEPKPSEPEELLVEPDVGLDAGSADTDAGVAAADTGAETIIPSSGCGGSISPGRHRRRGRLDSSMGQWEVHVPRGYDSTTPTPLVVVFHGSGGTPSELIDDAGIRAVADRHKFIAVAPHGGGWSFQARGDTPDNFRAMMQHVGEELCVDSSRVFALGHDSGGDPAEQLSCEPWIAGVATTSYRPADGFPPPCVGDSTGAKARIVFSPSQSKHLPLDAMGQCLGLQRPTLLAYEEHLLDRMGLTDVTPTSYGEKKQGDCQLWRSEDGALASCVMKDGHNWKGMAPRTFDVLRCDGPPSDYPFAEVAWQFWMESLESEDR